MSMSGICGGLSPVLLKLINPDGSTYAGEDDIIRIEDDFHVMNLCEAARCL